MRRPVAFTAAFLIAAAVQILVYKTYIEREIAWSFVFRGDPNWYVFYTYRLFEAFLRRDWAEIYGYAKTFPWGMVLFFEAIGTQLVFGASRFGMASVNLIYFLIAQAATFIVFRRIGGSAWSGLAAVLLLLAMRTPFRGDGPGLNIVDFHFDLVFFYVFLCIIYLVAWSDSFARRGPAIAIAALAALTVATRLVSFFLLIGIFGAFFLYLLVAWLRTGSPERERARRRAVNLVIAGLVFLVLCAPAVWVAADALYAHYFRFIFEEEIRQNRAVLYTMGSSLGDEAYELIRRMVAFDFGKPFGAAAVVLLLLALLGAGRAAAGRAAEETGGMLARLWNDRPARLVFAGFLLLSIVVSYGMHLVFPIKSDHLTRMTAAPILILALFLAAVPIGRAFAGRGWRRAAGFVLMGLLALLALHVQLGFYATKGKFEPRRADVEQVAKLYGDISKVVHARGMTTVGISTDKVVTYEYGALLGYYIYEYERHGRLLKWRPQLGDKVDESITLPQTRQVIDRSDFIVLTDGDYPTQIHWPFMKAVRSFHPELTAYVQSRYCLLGRYHIDGLTNALYTRPVAWRVAASASTQKQFGPEGLFGAGGIIWHAPWKAGASQWVSFEAGTPVRLSSIKIMAQDQAPLRAPRDFVLEALDDRGAARPILTVTGASFTAQQTQRWDIPETEPSRRFRVRITQNNGDTHFLTIQDMQVELADQPCEFGVAVK